VYCECPFAPQITDSLTRLLPRALSAETLPSSSPLLASRRSLPISIPPLPRYTSASVHNHQLRQRRVQRFPALASSNLRYVAFRFFLFSAFHDSLNDPSHSAYLSHISYPSVVGTGVAAVVCQAFLTLRIFRLTKSIVYPIFFGACIACGVRPLHLAPHPSRLFSKAQTPRRSS
jgi:hypothetical protein